jgi:chaperonin GroES
MKLLGYNILIKKAEKKETGVSLSEPLDQILAEGVIAGLPDWSEDKGWLFKMGDKVLVSKYAGEEYILDGEKVKIIKSEDIIAILD